MNEKMIIDIHKRFRVYIMDIKNIWEEYNYIKAIVEKYKLDSYKFISLNSNKHYLTKNKKDSGGFQNRILRGSNQRNHFIESISLFEYYITDLAEIVYLTYPNKLEKSSINNEKLMELIIRSDSKEDMINYIIQEKLRSIFYGNPVDVFVKDKCKLELGEIFKNEYYREINLYAEIVARRNIIIHNQGRVDNKYIKEISNTNFKLNQKIILDDNYLRGTLALLKGIAAKVTECVICNIGKGYIDGKLKNEIEKFKRCTEDDWYTKLLTE